MFLTLSCINCWVSISMPQWHTYSKMCFRKCDSTLQKMKRGEGGPYHFSKILTPLRGRVALTRLSLNSRTYKEHTGMGQVSFTWLGQAMAAKITESVLVTGANRGIGLELVRQLCESPCPPDQIFAGCRDPNGPRAKVPVKPVGEEGLTWQSGKTAQITMSYEYSPCIITNTSICIGWTTLIVTVGMYVCGQFCRKWTKHVNLTICHFWLWNLHKIKCTFHVIIHIIIPMHFIGVMDMTKIENCICSHLVDTV